MKNFLLIVGIAAFSFGNCLQTRACFGAGCYWGTEKFIKSDFERKFPSTIISGQVGFMGPKTAKPNPTYRQVCSGTTGHVEVYDFHFQGDEKTYEELVKHFFSFHDPTTKDRQGNDQGTQYASVIYVYDNIQREIAEKVKNELQGYINNNRNPYSNNIVTTEVRDATDFFSAHSDHQEYLNKNPRGYCNHRYRFMDWDKAFK
mmetsp:Transcript_22293/g.22465  ORF Transcript_22293/g.22465 Transcript_22293/m.22465 type:complete len:202 (-) Transcript_22293:36-641(-)